MRLWGRQTWHLFELRSLLGIVTNDLVAECTRPCSALETVLSGFFSSIGLWPNHRVTPDMERRAMEALRFFDIDHLASRPMNEMSSGEVRRAVFARALVHDPQALVLDEPTNSLDVRAQHEVREAMGRLARSGRHRDPRHPPPLRHHPGNPPRHSSERGPHRVRWRKESALNPERLSALFGVPVRLLEADGLYHMW